MRVAITGDRDWGDEERRRPASETLMILRALQTLDPKTDFVVLGDARGADTIARIACEELGLSHRVHEADWDKYKDFPEFDVVAITDVYRGDGTPIQAGTRSVSPHERAERARSRGFSRGSSRLSLPELDAGLRR